MPRDQELLQSMVNTILRSPRMGEVELDNFFNEFLNAGMIAKEDIPVIMRMVQDADDKLDKLFVEPEED